MSTKVFSLARHNRKEELESYLDANEEIYPVDTPDDYLTAQKLYEAKNNTDE